MKSTLKFLRANDNSASFVSGGPLWVTVEMTRKGWDLLGNPMVIESTLVAGS